jgi:hypothetical protein
MQQIDDQNLKKSRQNIFCIATEYLWWLGIRVLFLDRIWKDAMIWLASSPPPSPFVIFLERGDDWMYWVLYTWHILYICTITISESHPRVIFAHRPLTHAFILGEYYTLNAPCMEQAERCVVYPGSILIGWQWCGCWFVLAMSLKWCV